MALWHPKHRLYRPPDELWVPGKNVRALGHGHGQSLAFGRGPIWTPESLVRVYGGFLVDPNASGALTKPTAFALADGNMEAVGVGSWLVNAATLTKDTVAPHGGTQCLKVVSAALGWASQSASGSEGLRYYWDGWRKNEPGTTVYYYLGTGSPVASASDTAWTRVQHENTLTSWLVAFANSSGGGTSYWDDWTATLLSVETVTPTAVGAALAGMTFGQSTETAMGWQSRTQIDGNECLQFDGVADFYQASTAASTFTSLHATGSTIQGVVAPDTTATGERVIIDDCNNDPSERGIYCAYDAADQSIILRVGNGSGTWHIEGQTGTGTFPRNEVHVIDAIWSSAVGYSIAVDGVVGATGVSVGNAPGSTAPPGAMRIGATVGGANFFAGRLGLITCYGKGL